MNNSETSTAIASTTVRRANNGETFTEEPNTTNGTEHIRAIFASRGWRANEKERHREIRRVLKKTSVSASQSPTEVVWISDPESSRSAHGIPLFLAMGTDASELAFRVALSAWERI